MTFAQWIHDAGMTLADLEMLSDISGSKLRKHASGERPLNAADYHVVTRAIALHRAKKARINVYLRKAIGVPDEEYVPGVEMTDV